VDCRVATILALALCAAGCLQSSTVTCADGRLCGGGAVCDDLHQACVEPDQLVTCVDIADGVDCEIGGAPTGICKDEVCLRRGCGDGFVTLPEECDGANLAGLTCLDRGFYVRDGLACTDDCELDDGACMGVCGDGEINGTNEHCDDDELADKTCADFGFYRETPGLQCSGACTYDTSGCSDFCGDLIRNGIELCDGAPPTDDTCLDYGFDAGRLACGGLCAPIFSACQRFGWRLRATGVGSLRGAWGAGTEVFAVGGGIAHFDGATWAPMTSGTTEALSDVWAADASHAFAVGAAGTILRYDGTAWSPMTSGVAVTLTDVWGSAADDVWAVGLGDTILHYDGVAWSASTHPAVAGLFSVWGNGAADVWAGGAGTILHWNGLAWTASASPTTDPLVDMSGAGLAHVVAITEGNVGVRWNGAAWTAFAIPTTDVTSAVWTAGPDDIVIATEGRLVQFDGLSWTTLDTPFTLTMNALWGESAASLVAVGSTAAWHGQGTSAQPALIATPQENITSVWGSGSDDIYVVGLRDLVMHYDGSTWSTLDVVPCASQFCYFLSDVSGSGPDDVYIVSGGLVLHRDASTWTEIPSAGAPISDVWSAEPAHAYLVGASGMIRHADGQVLTPMTSPVTVPLFDVDGRAWDDVWAVGGQGTVVHYDGASWSVVAIDTVADLYSVLVLDDGTVVVGGTGGVVRQRSGTTWIPLDLPGPSSVNGLFGSDPADLFAVSGGLLHHDGVVWSPVRHETGLALNALGGAPNHLVYAGDDGMIHALHREVPWRCRATETRCADHLDDDCDGRTDSADPDCP
jgi:hypothetical protein